MFFEFSDTSVVDVSWHQHAAMVGSASYVLFHYAKDLKTINKQGYGCSF
jgi:hypothetical protein